VGPARTADPQAGDGGGIADTPPFAAIRTTVGSGPSVTSILNALISTGKSIADNRSGGTITKPRIQVDSALNILACVGAPNMFVSPATALKFYGPTGGPFYSDAAGIFAGRYTIYNTGTGSLNYSVSAPSWLAVSPTSGTVGCGQSMIVTILHGPSAVLSGVGNASSTIAFTNTTNRSGNASIATSIVVFQSVPDQLNVAQSFKPLPGMPYTP
jgi:hypothetical protein